MPRSLWTIRDLERGFLLLSDLGSRQYLDELAVPGAADRSYGIQVAKLAGLPGAVIERA